MTAKENLSASLTFVTAAAAALLLAGAPVPAEASEPSCNGTRGEKCEEFTTCFGIGLKVCTTNYYYWIY